MVDEEQKEILHRLDERTEHIQNSVERLDGRLDKNERQIKKNRAMAENNETKIALGAYTSGAIFTTIVAKLSGLLPW